MQYSITRYHERAKMMRETLSCALPTAWSRHRESRLPYGTRFLGVGTQDIGHFGLSDHIYKRFMLI